MKKVFYIVIVLLSVLFGFLRFFDLETFTDEEGFVTVLSSSSRYLIMLIMLLFALFYALKFGQKGSRPYSSNSVALAMCIVGIVHIICGIFSLLLTVGASAETVSLILSISMISTGLWFGIFGFVSFMRGRLEGGLLFFAIIASVLYYVLMLNNYLSLVSSSHRISHVVAILVPMSVVVFFNIFIKQFFFVSKNNKFLVFSGLAVFFIAGCIGSAELIHTIINGTAAAMPIMQSVCSVSMGIFGVVCSYALNPKKAVVIY